MTNTQIVSNTAAGGSGALYLVDGGALDRVVLRANYVGSGGEGAAVLSEGSLSIINSLLAANGVEGGGSVVTLDTDEGAMVIQYTTIASATADVGTAVEVITGTLTSADNIFANYAVGIANRRRHS
jgi:hypothetical protein